LEILLSTTFRTQLRSNAKVELFRKYILEKEGLLSAELKEQVRRTLAQKNGCEYCKAKGKPEIKKFDEKISIAVAFTEVFLKQKVIYQIHLIKF
jgi:alkylhydroperoxidase family enzyme